MRGSRCCSCSQQLEDDIQLTVDELVEINLCDNRAFPTDDFPIPTTEMVIDSTTGYGALSFMDGFSGYNQIKMDEHDAIDTAFRTYLPEGHDSRAW